MKNRNEKRELSKVKNILKLILLFTKKDFLTLGEIAKNLGVHGRTVFRYLDDLRELGFQVEHSGKGYYIINKSEVSKLSEIYEVLDDIRNFSNLLVLASTSPFSSVFDINPNELLSNMLNKYSKKYLEMISFGYEINIDKKLLKTLFYAIEHRRNLLVKYKSFSGEFVKEEERKISPYFILYRRRAIYVVAYCHSRQEIRTFRMDRVAECSLLNEIFEIPPDFNPSEYVKSGFEVFLGRGNKIKIKSIVSEKLAEMLRISPKHPSQKLYKDQNNYNIFEIEISKPEEFIFWAMSWGKNIKIIEPEEVVELIKKTLRETISLYENQS